MTSESEIITSAKNLSAGYQATPLRDFWGKLDHFVPRRDEKYQRSLIDMGFTDLTVIASTEPYKHLIAQITIPYGIYKNTSWGIFLSSADQFLQEGEDLKSLVGSYLHLVLTPGHNFGILKDTGEPNIRDCWECTEVRGRETGGEVITPLQQALNLLDGKSEMDFNQVVLADGIVKRDAGLVNQILSKAFLPALQAAGKAEPDASGIWHIKREAEAPSSV